MAQDEVNGVRFWGERQIPDNVENWPQGKIESRDVSLAVAAGDPAVLAYQSDWLGAGGTPILNESTTVQVHGNRLLEYTVTLRAAESDVIINDTKEGFCARRRCFLVVSSLLANANTQRALLLQSGSVWWMSCGRWRVQPSSAPVSPPSRRLLTSQEVFEAMRLSGLSALGLGGRG